MTRSSMCIFNHYFQLECLQNSINHAIIKYF
uniref:Uncharacterized protein n=1 Tax=Arundo donax TaxID=35708 RepID=A0A0A9BK16_ARUDO